MTNFSPDNVSWDLLNSISNSSALIISSLRDSPTTNDCLSTNSDEESSIITVTLSL